MSEHLLSEHLHPDELVDANDLDARLNRVDYRFLNDGSYVPSEFALLFMNFVKLVNGKAGEENRTPAFHLRMLDEAFATRKDVVNLVFRGAAKTTLFMEYLSFFAAIFRELPGIGELEGMLYVSDSMENGVKNARENMQARYDKSAFLREHLPQASFTEKRIVLTNQDGERFTVRMYGAKTGVRGTKIDGKRPKLAVLDDLLSDDDAKSKAAIQSIKDTIYKGIEHALHPQRRKIIFNGTPFNKEDPIVEAVESGAWATNVWPVCEQWPCTREDFVGAWPDRFDYDTVLARYEKAAESKHADGFFQELMLRLTSDEDRLVRDEEIRWFPRSVVVRNKSAFNFYFTTDFATSEKQTADLTVIGVWAYTSNEDWLLTDCVCARQTMDKTFDDLFRLVVDYGPQQVSVEVTGQQGAFIALLRKEMFRRNIWFNFTCDPKTGAEGIRPATSKLTRFNMALPSTVKAGKFHLPEEWRSDPRIAELLGQLRLATKSGIKGKDDWLDNVSQLPFFNAWRPQQGVVPAPAESRLPWGLPDVQEEPSGLASYIV